MSLNDFLLFLLLKVCTSDVAVLVFLIFKLKYIFKYTCGRESDKKSFNPADLQKLDYFFGLSYIYWLIHFSLVRSLTPLRILYNNLGTGRHSLSK